MNSLSKPRCLGLIVLLLLGLLLLWYFRDRGGSQDSASRSSGKTAPPTTRSSRPAQPDGKKESVDGSGENDPGEIEVPGLGRISYARHRFVRIADIAKYVPKTTDTLLFHSDVQDLYANIGLDVYEDREGYIVMISHRLGRFPSEPRDADAIREMAGFGVEFKLLKRSQYRADDPKFMVCLLREVDGELTCEAYNGRPELPREFVILPVQIWFNSKYNGKYPLDSQLHGLLFRSSRGTDSEYYYEDKIAREDTYLRRWGLSIYESDKPEYPEGIFTSVNGSGLVERRLDIKK